MADAINQFSLVILKSHFEATRGIFWDRPRNFEPRSDDEDDAVSCLSRMSVCHHSPNFRTTPVVGRLTPSYDLTRSRPNTRRIFSGIGFRPWKMKIRFTKQAYDFIMQQCFGHKGLSLEFPRKIILVDMMTGDDTTVYPVSEEISLDEIYCSFSYLNQTNISNESFCNATWDGLSCWPLTAAGSTATISCFPEFNGVKYDVS
ncbi:hypothetical protein AVEN_38326-1, partial [Araneus ventricosus]